MKRLRLKLKSGIDSVLNSYAQIFFSDGKLLGLALLLVSFFNFNAGLSGVIAIFSAHLVALFVGLNKVKIVNGLYGFNSLLVGLGLGIFYQFNGQLLMLVIFASVLTLFITVVTEAILNKYSLPFLSLPFLIGMWIVTLASRHYANLEISELGVYAYNDMVLLGGDRLFNLHLAIHDWSIPASIELYFISLGAIFFQYNIYAGFIIAVALLFNSRISFLLSLLGFYSALAYYQFIGASFEELNYSYIGFNFILTAIAVGGYFLIPSSYSFLSTLILIPLLSLMVTGSMEILMPYQLSTYSLPFNVMVISFLLVLKYRERNFRRPEFVSLQRFSPEKNLYANLNFYKRFGSSLQWSIQLPFLGQWTINQAHNGAITHKNEWQHAWDFVITEDGMEYYNQGTKLEDFLCYNKPIIAPANGEIVEIVDYYDDNEIGQMDVVHNWGNSLVIKHADYLYSQVSHIKKGSFQVKKGQFVTKGDVLAMVGNSGRSPYPHLHFQIQATPYVGSKTLRFPLGPFIRSTENKFDFAQRAYPQLNEVVSNIAADRTLKRAFGFVTGQEIQWKLVSSSKEQVMEESMLKWVVGIDFYNQTYLYSEATQSYAYFTVSDDDLIFTSYIGSHQDPLYWFYLSLFRLIFGFYKGMEVTDELPVPISNAKIWKILQDFVAPFVIFIKPSFKLKYVSRKQFFDESEILINTQFQDKVFGKVFRQIDSEISCLLDDSILWNVKIGKNHYSFQKIKNEK